MSAPARPSVPARNVATDEVSMRKWLGEITEWVSVTGAALFDLDEAAGASTESKFRDDVALAFMIWQPVNDRVQHFADHRPDRANGREAIVESCWQPVVAASGEAVANDLGGAMTMLHALIVKLTDGRADAQRAAVTTAEAWSKVLSDLATADKLSSELGDQIRRVAELSAQVSAAPRTAAPPAALATQVAAVRADLDGVVRRRDELLARARTATDELAALAVVEREVDELAERCRSRIAAPPRLAVPTVERLTPPGEISGRPWGAVREELESWVRTVDRLGKAFAEARRRFAAPLDERDELRGLIQAFRDKAGASRLAERPHIDELYTRARDVLWAAPCDLDLGRTLVADYVAAVNTAIGTPAASRTSSPQFAPPAAPRSQGVL